MCLLRAAIKPESFNQQIHSGGGMYDVDRVRQMRQKPSRSAAKPWDT